MPLNEQEIAEVNRLTALIGTTNAEYTQLGVEIRDLEATAKTKAERYWELEKLLRPNFNGLGGCTNSEECYHIQIRTIIDTAAARDAETAVQE